MSGTSGVFSESVKSVLVSENDVFFTFTSTMTPSWGIGKYWNYCQKLYWRKSKTFTSKPRNTSGAVNIPGKEYSVLATTGEWTTDTEATVACVILKNPKWEEEDDSTTLSHKIQAKGYATQVGANNPGSADYTTGVEGTIECSSNYLGVVGGSCALNQLNVLSQNVSAYFGHTIRRYDNGAFGSDRINYDSSLFDESKSGVSEGSNFWKDACLRTTVDGGCVKTSRSRFAVNQKNSMYAYAGMSNSELASIGLDYDPLSIREIRRLEKTFGLASD